MDRLNKSIETNTPGEWPGISNEVNKTKAAFGGLIQEGITGVDNKGNTIRIEWPIKLLEEAFLKYSNLIWGNTGDEAVKELKKNLNNKDFQNRIIEAYNHLYLKPGQEEGALLSSIVSDRKTKQEQRALAVYALIKPTEANGQSAINPNGTLNKELTRNNGTVQNGASVAEQAIRNDPYSIDNIIASALEKKKGMR